MEWPAVRVERFHHRQIRTDADQEDALSGQLPIERLLQSAFEANVCGHEVRDLVEHHDASLVGQGRRQKAQRRIPPRELDAVEEGCPREVGNGHLLSESSELLTDWAARSREEQVGNVNAADELLDETGLTDPAATANQERLARLLISVGPDALQQSR